MSNFVEWPDGLYPRTFSIQLVSNSKIFKSPFSGAVQTVAFPGSHWVISMGFENMDDRTSRHFEAFIAEMDGVSGRVRMWDIGRGGRSQAGKPVVSSSNQLGNLLATRGWLADRLVLRRGDYVSVNDELKMVLRDVKSDVSGQAVIRISPMLRDSPAPGTAIECRKPTGIFRLDDEQGPVTRTPGIFNSATLKLVESF